MARHHERYRNLQSYQRLETEPRLESGFSASFEEVSGNQLFEYFCMTRFSLLYFEDFNWSPSLCDVSHVSDGVEVD